MGYKTQGLRLCDVIGFLYNLLIFGQNQKQKSNPFDQTHKLGKMKNFSITPRASLTNFNFSYNTFGLTLISIYIYMQRLDY